MIDRAVQLSVTFQNWRRKEAGEAADKTGIRVSSRHTPSGQLSDGRSPGSRVVAPSCLPSLAGQWHSRILLAAYSCGGSHGLDPWGSHRVPFSPLAFRLGDHHRFSVDFPQSLRNGFLGRSGGPARGNMHFTLSICNNITHLEDAAWRCQAKPAEFGSSAARGRSTAVPYRCATVTGSVRLRGMRNFDQTGRARNGRMIWPMRGAK